MLLHTEIFSIKRKVYAVGRAVTILSLEREIQRFKSRGGQIRHSVANGSPLLQHFFERSCVSRGAMTQRWAPQIGYTLRRNSARIMKDLMKQNVFEVLLEKNQITLTCFQYLPEDESFDFIQYFPAFKMSENSEH